MKKIQTFLVFAVIMLASCTVTQTTHTFYKYNTTTNNLSTNVENFKTWEKNSWANTYANINPNLTNDNRLPFTNQETSAYEVRWGQK